MFSKIMIYFLINCVFVTKMFYFYLETQMIWERLLQVKEALKKLPPAHYNTLSYLMAHLYR